MRTAEKRAVAGTGIWGTTRRGSLLTPQTPALQVLLPFPKSQHDASAHQVDMREREPEDPRGSQHRQGMRHTWGRGEFPLGSVSPRQPHGVSRGEGQGDLSCCRGSIPARGLGGAIAPMQKWPGPCLCHLLESVKSFLSEITNPGAFTTPLLKSTFHSSVSSCLPSA